jgi:hypothetical protein
MILASKQSKYNMAVHWTARAMPFEQLTANQPFRVFVEAVVALAATDRRRWGY